MAVGAGVGAILGQVIGRDTKSTLLGAGIGAVLGGIAGNQVGLYMDNQEKELREALASSEAASVQRVKAVQSEVQSARAEAKEGDVQTAQDVLTATFKSEFLFDTNSFTLKPGAYSEINRVATVLKNYPQTLISVEGHTDSKGAEQYNMDLSKKRAEAVKAALVQQGVDAARIEAEGFGETQPIYSEDAMNRRVTVVIKPVIKAVG